MHDLDAIRRHCQERLGDRVEVSVAVRDHGAAQGIVIKMLDGWRHAYLLHAHSTATEVADHLQAAVGARRYIERMR